MECLFVRKPPLQMLIAEVVFLFSVWLQVRAMLENKFVDIVISVAKTRIKKVRRAEPHAQKTQSSFYATKTLSQQCVCLMSLHFYQKTKIHALRLKYKSFSSKYIIAYNVANCKIFFGCHTFCLVLRWTYFSQEK